MFWVDSFLNISKSIAGAINIGALHDKYVAKKKLSPLPDTIFDKVLAVAGAITIISDQEPNSTWLFHSPVSVFFKKSLYTGFLDRVDSVTGVINCRADSVRITLTLAPLLIKSLTK